MDTYLYPYAIRMSAEERGHVKGSLLDEMSMAYGIFDSKSRVFVAKAFLDAVLIFPSSNESASLMVFFGSNDVCGNDCCLFPVFCVIQSTVKTLESSLRSPFVFSFFIGLADGCLRSTCRRWSGHCYD